MLGSAPLRRCWGDPAEVSVPPVETQALMRVWEFCGVFLLSIYFVFVNVHVISIFVCGLCLLWFGPWVWQIKEMMMMIRWSVTPEGGKTNNWIAYLDAVLGTQFFFFLPVAVSSEVWLLKEVFPDTWCFFISDLRLLSVRPDHVLVWTLCRGSIYRPRGNFHETGLLCSIDRPRRPEFRFTKLKLNCENRLCECTASWRFKY